MTTKINIIQKEDAVFWMGENGDWFNEHGKLEHPKIIRYFHHSIQKDENGYFLYQKNGPVEEKVYFSYHHTAIFVFKIKKNDRGIGLILNTGETIQLIPTQLEEKEDKLFIKTKEHLIQFTNNALLKISEYLKEENGILFFQYQDGRYPIERNG